MLKATTKSCCPTRRMNFRIQADLAELDKMRKQLIAFAKCNSLSDEIVNLAMLSIDEICTNLIKYAYKYDKSKIIDISIEIKNNKFITIIKDNSPPFDICKHAPKSVVEHVKNLNIGGLGMYIVMNITDEVFYEQKSEGNPFNTLTLIKYL